MKQITTLITFTLIISSLTIASLQSMRLETSPEGQSVLQQDEDGKTLLHKACEKGDVHAVGELIVIASAYDDHSKMLTELLVMKDNFGDTALNIACKTVGNNKDNKIKCAEKIIDSAAGVDDDFQTFKSLSTATDSFGKISLQWACFYNLTAVVERFFSFTSKIPDDFKTLKTLLTWKNNNCETALWIACLNRTPLLRCVTAILNATVDIPDNFETVKTILTARSVGGEIALIPCCPSAPADEENGLCARMLMQTSFEIPDNFETTRTMLAAKTDDGKTAWDLAWYRGEITPCMHVLMDAYQKSGLEVPTEPSAENDAI